MQGKNLSYFQLSHLQSGWKKKTARTATGLVKHLETFATKHGFNVMENDVKITLVDLTNVEEGHSKLRGLQDFL